MPPAGMDMDSYKKQYLRRLHKSHPNEDGYPATIEALKEFNRDFYDDMDLPGEEHKTLVHTPTLSIALSGFAPFIIVFFLYYKD